MTRVRCICPRCESIRRRDRLEFWSNLALALAMIAIAYLGGR